MAQSQIFRFGDPNSTRLLNNHIANIVAPGAYSGLRVVQTEPPSMNASITLGYSLTDEGIKITESVDQPGALTFSAADPAYPRMDLVVQRHRYTDVAGDPNPALYVIIQGVPTETTQLPPANYAGMQAGDIPLTEVRVRANATSIVASDIFNLKLTPTMIGLRDEMADTLYTAIGNFAVNGWELTFGTNSATVAPGVGMLGGLRNVSTTNFTVNDFIMRSNLYYRDDPDTHIRQEVGENLTLNVQPSYSTKLIFRVTTTGVATSGTIFVSGKNELDEEVHDEPVLINQAANTTVDYPTVNRFSEVFHEGIDCARTGFEVTRSGAHIYLEVLTKPEIRILAVGHDSGYATFRSTPDASYKVKRNELILGYAEVNETGIVPGTTVVDPISAFAMIYEDLAPQCNGLQKSFSIRATPPINTELVVLDGIALAPNGPKGYIIDGKVLTLGASIPAPDGASTVHGTAGSTFWIKYAKMNREEF